MENDKLKVIDPNAESFDKAFNVEESDLDRVSEKLKEFFENEMDILHGEKPDDDYGSGETPDGYTSMAKVYIRWNKAFPPGKDEQTAFVKVLGWAFEFYHSKTCRKHGISEMLDHLIGDLTRNQKHN